MKEVELKSVIQECQMKELTAEEQHLIELAIEATQRSYAPSAPPCSLPAHSIPTRLSECWRLPHAVPTEN